MVSEKIISNLSRSSWIRAMFEEGEKLRTLYGADKVFDFSLGNPDIEPPTAVKDASRKFASLMTFLVRYGGLLPPSTDALILICILSTPSKSARGIPFANPEYRNFPYIRISINYTILQEKIHGACISYTYTKVI